MSGGKQGKMADMEEIERPDDKGEDGVSNKPPRRPSLTSLDRSLI
jgi:hypothetical protein